MKSRLKAVLADTGVTMRALAESFGVHEVTVGRWCTNEGFGMLTMRKAEAIARHLGCSVKDLFEE